MFGKSKKNQQAPIDEMERFYLDQFFNSNKQTAPNQTNFLSGGKKGFGLFGKQNQPMQQMGMPSPQTTMGDPNLNLDSYLFKNPNQDLQLMGRPNPQAQMNGSNSYPMQDQYGFNAANGPFQQMNPQSQQPNGFYNAPNGQYPETLDAFPYQQNAFNPYSGEGYNQTPPFGTHTPSNNFGDFNSANQPFNPMGSPQVNQGYYDAPLMYQQTPYNQPMNNQLGTPFSQPQEYTNVTTSSNLPQEGYNPNSAYFYNPTQAISPQSGRPSEFSNQPTQPMSFEGPAIKHHIAREETPFHLQVNPIIPPVAPTPMAPNAMPSSPLAHLAPSKTVQASIEEHDNQLLLLNHRVMRIENILKSQNMS